MAAPRDVVETSVVHRSHDVHAAIINQYQILYNLGEGMHGKVMLALDTITNERVAIKSIRRIDPRDRRLPRSTRPGAPISAQQETEAKIRREIAVMKKCTHQNLVRLLEVIDDRNSKKIYLVMENLAGGEVLWRNKDNVPVLALDQVQRIMRDVTLGLEYLHLQGIIHRDIKPANLLWTADRQSVKICDFGVSHFSFATAQDGVTYDEYGLSKTAGSPAFFAPEVCNWNTDTVSPSASRNPSPITKKIDIWALGVTFYCLLFGKPPWQGISEWAMFRSICTEEFIIPDTMSAERIPTGGREHHPDGREIGWCVVDILCGLLEKEQSRRMTLAEIKRVTWIQTGVRDPERWLRETAPESQSLVEVTDEEAKNAIRTAWYSNMSLKNIKDKIRSSLTFSRARSSTRPSLENAVADPNKTPAKGADTSRKRSVVDRQLKRLMFGSASSSSSGPSSSPASASTPASSAAAAPLRANTVPKQNPQRRSRASAHTRSDPASTSISCRTPSLQAFGTASSIRTSFGTTTTASPATSDLPGFRSRVSAMLRQQSAKVVSKVRASSRRGANERRPAGAGRTSVETFDVVRLNAAEEGRGRGPGGDGDGDGEDGVLLLSAEQRAASWSGESPQDDALNSDPDPTRSVVAFGAGGYADRPAAYQQSAAWDAVGPAVAVAEAASDSSGTTSTATPHADAGPPPPPPGRMVSPLVSTTYRSDGEVEEDDDDDDDALSSDVIEEDDDDELPQDHADDDDDDDDDDDGEEYSSDEDVIELRTRRPSAVLSRSPTTTATTTTTNNNNTSLPRR